MGHIVLCAGDHVLLCLLCINDVLINSSTFIMIDRFLLCVFWSLPPMDSLAVMVEAAVMAVEVEDTVGEADMEATA